MVRIGKLISAVVQESLATVMHLHQAFVFHQTFLEALTPIRILEIVRFVCQPRFRCQPWDVLTPDNHVRFTQGGG